MRIPSTRRWRVLVPLLTISLLAAACGSDDSGAAGDEVSGTVNVSGSSTVAPITQRVAEFFEDEAAGVTVNVDGPGTGDGFVLFCNGETDISDASRAIKEEEAQACADKGIEFIELKVAFDGLAVITHPDNDIECLNFADLYALSGPESQGFKTWADAAPLAKELGSSTVFPSGPLDISAPGEESGTYDSYLELALADIAEERGKDEVTRPDYQSSGDDNIILQGVEGSSTSFGWVGLAYAREAGDALKIVQVSAEPGGECVSPTDETVADGSYPLSRPLFIYVNSAKLDESPALAAFVDFYLTDAGLAAVPEVGYVTLGDDDIEATRSAWEAKELGTREG